MLPDTTNPYARAEVHDAMGIALTLALTVSLCAAAHAGITTTDGANYPWPVLH